MISDSEPPGLSARANRHRLGFVRSARTHFSFLAEAGFVETHAEPTIVRFDREHVRLRDDLQVAVTHDRLSYELGVEFARSIRVGSELVEQEFPLGAMIEARWPHEPFRAPAAMTAELVDGFLADLAVWARRVLEWVDADIDAAFNHVSDANAQSATAERDQLRALRLRSKADDAWRRKDFASVLNAYEEIESELDTVELRASEQGRLRYARKHQGN